MQTYSLRQKSWGKTIGHNLSLATTMKTMKNQEKRKYNQRFLDGAKIVLKEYLIISNIKVINCQIFDIIFTVTFFII